MFYDERECPNDFIIFVRGNNRKAFFNNIFNYLRLFSFIVSITAIGNVEKMRGRQCELLIMLKGNLFFCF